MDIYFNKFGTKINFCSPPLTEILRRSMRYVHLFSPPRSSDKQCGHEKIVNSKPILFSEIARHWRENKRREVSDRNLTITGARERACIWWAHCQNNSRKNIPNELREYVIRLNDVWRHAIELSQSYSRIQLQTLWSDTRSFTSATTLHMRSSCIQIRPGIKMGQS